MRSKQLHLQRHPQLQAAKHLVNFVLEADGVGKLLVVYYVGHGRAGVEGQLMLSGSSTTPQDEDQHEDQHEDEEEKTAAAAEDASIDWSAIETPLAKTRGNVLVILDCCCAGLVCQSPSLRMRSGRRRRGKFLYVAACKADQRTPSGGPTSFTTAMIWALGKLAGEAECGFTVRRLVKTLMAYEHFPRATQEVVVFERGFGEAAINGDI